MTVKQLREKLEKYPDSMQVFMAPRITNFSFGLLNSVTSDEITFSEDERQPGDKELPKETVVILDEE